MPPKLIAPLKKDSENRLETTAVLNAGTATIGAISNTTFNQGAVSDHGRWMQGLDYPSTLRYVRVNSEGKLETVGIIESGTIGVVGRVGTVGDIEHLGSIANTKFNQGSLDDHDRWIKGDDVGTKRYVKVASDGKLQTVSLLEAGTSVIGNLDRVATVGQIDHLGSIANTEFDIGRVGTIADIEHLGSIANTEFDIGTAGRVIRVDTLGTVGRVKDIDNLGTVGRLATIGMIEAGTISEVGHVGTVGNITHLGSIGNTSFDQGVVSDHERHMHIKQYGTWQFLQGTSNCAYVEPLVEHNNALVNLEVCNMGGLITAPGWDGTLHVPLQTDDNRRLKTAPATSRKGGKKVVTNQGTAVALVASSTPCISVIVKALHTNAGEVYVGDNTVGSATGYPLQKDEFISFSCDNVNGVYIDRNAGTQGVSFLYVNY